MARHGCGVFGNTAAPFDNDTIDRIDHLFDCIEIDQTFSFYDGQAYFSSRYYDSNIAHVFRDIYDQVHLIVYLYNSWKIKPQNF